MWKKKIYKLLDLQFDYVVEKERILSNIIINFKKCLDDLNVNSQSKMIIYQKNITYSMNNFHYYFTNHQTNIQQHISNQLNDYFTILSNSKLIIAHLISK